MHDSKTLAKDPKWQVDLPGVFVTRFSHVLTDFEALSPIAQNQIGTILIVSEIGQRRARRKNSAQG